MKDTKENLNDNIMEDEQIIELYWARNEQAISETDKKYKRYLYSIAYNILHDSMDCEECLNDTYLGTWNAIPPSRPSIFQIFLSKIMRNTAVTRYKKNTADKRIPSEMTISLEELDQCIPSSFSAEEEYLISELGRLLSGYIEYGAIGDINVKIYTDATEIPELWKGEVFSENNVILGVKEFFIDDYGVCYAVTETDTILVGCSVNATTVNIPSGVTRIANLAFERCDFLTSIILPDTVKYLDFNAFGHMYGLKTIFIPKSVEVIEGNLVYRYDNEGDCSVYVAYKENEIPDQWDISNHCNIVAYNVKSITVDADGNVTNVIYNS